MIAERTNISVRETGPIPGAFPAGFPEDLTDWTDSPALLRTVRSSGAHVCGNSWLNLVRDRPMDHPADDLLVAVAYCYLQGIYNSVDVIRHLDSDEALGTVRGRLGVGPERIRRFRRDHRRALTDCLTRALLSLWRQRNPAAASSSDHLIRNRMNFDLLEPFYLEAKDRLERAVMVDSMALDY